MRDAEDTFQLEARYNRVSHAKPEYQVKISDKPVDDWHQIHD